MRGQAFRMEIETRFDAADVAARLAARSGDAQKRLDAQVIKDSNFFCPLKTSTLQKSALVHSVIGSGEVVWRTPYARAQYHGERLDHSRQSNPNARAKWFEAAKARNLENWRRIVENAVEPG